MKQQLLKNFLLISTIVFVFFSQHANAQFGKGNLVVLRVGSDTGTLALTSNAYPVFLDEISKSGTFVKTFAIPTSGTAKLTLSGTATTEGQMTLSQDSTQLVIAGYNTAPGTVAVSKTSSKTVNRIVDIVKQNGKFIKASASDTFFSANTFRSAASDKGKNFWGSGSNTGTPYIGKDTPAVLQKFVLNTRVVNVYKGQLYFSTASAAGDSGIGIYHLGSGLPLTAGQNFKVIALTGDNSIPGAFVFNSSATILYVANEDSASGAIQKWIKKASGKWSLSKTFSLGFRAGTRGVCVDFSDANYPTIYATTTNEKIVKFKDSAAKPTVTVIYTAPIHTIIRGIQFTPVEKKKTVGLIADDEDISSVISKAITVSLYPNPVNNSASLTIAAQKQEKYNLTISNVSGRIISVQEGILFEGVNKISVNTFSLKKGMYVASIIIAEGSSSVKFEKE